MIKVLTHGGRPHVDEILACTLLAIHHQSDELEIKRVNKVNPNDETQYDYIVDIGMKYDSIKYFDHHQDKNLESSALLIYNDIFKNKNKYLDKLLERISLQDTNGPKILLKDKEVKTEGVLTEMLFIERIMCRLFESDPIYVVNKLSKLLMNTENYKCNIDKKIKNIEKNIIGYFNDVGINTENFDLEKEIFNITDDDRVKIVYKFTEKYINYLLTIKKIGDIFISEQITVDIDSLMMLENIIFNDDEFIKTILRYGIEDNIKYEKMINAVSNIVYDKSEVVKINNLNVLIVDPVKLEIDLSIPSNIINGAQSKIINDKNIHIVIGYDNSRVDENTLYNRTLYRTFNGEKEGLNFDNLDLESLKSKIIFRNKFLVTLSNDVTPSEIIENIFNK